MIRFLSRNLVDEITNIIIMLMQTTNVILSPDTSNAFCKQSNAYVLDCVQIWNFEFKKLAIAFSYP